MLGEIDKQMLKLKKEASILVVDDCSKDQMPTFKKLSNIEKIEIIKLKKNLGSQKAIAIGLKYLNKNKNNSIIIVMDSDGEDDVEKIPEMIKTALDNPLKVVVSCRTKRQESYLFKILYFFHKLITFLFTWNWISFGSFSSFHSDNLNQILKNNSSWLAFSAALCKNSKIIKLFAERKKRYDGNSKLSFGGLIYHSIRVNSVFLIRATISSSVCIAISLNLEITNFFLKNLSILGIIIYLFLLIIVSFLNKTYEILKFEEFIDKKMIIK